MDPLEREIQTTAATLARLQRTLTRALRKARRQGTPWDRLAELADTPSSTIRYRLTHAKGQQP